MIRIWNYLVPKGYIAITLFPFILLRASHLRTNNVLINHERIHLGQQSELLIVPFYAWYGLEFLIRLVYYKNFSRAYRNISFEREAYKNENDLNYLKSRPFFNFLKYL